MSKLIEFTILHKDGKGLGAKLPDGTIIVADFDNKGLRIALPKSKWKKIFEEKQKDWKYYEFVIDKYELEMLIKSFDYKEKLK